MISLSQNIPINKKNEYNLLNKSIKTRKEKEVKADTKYFSLNDKNNGKTDHIDEPSKNRNNNEDKKFIFENGEINNDLIKLNLYLDEDKKELYPEEMDINKGIDIGQNDKKEKTIFLKMKKTILVIM